MNPTPPPTPEDLKREPEKDYERFRCAKCDGLHRSYIRLFCAERERAERAEQRVRGLEAEHAATLCHLANCHNDLYPIAALAIFPTSAR